MKKLAQLFDSGTPVEMKVGDSMVTFSQGKNRIYLITEGYIAIYQTSKSKKRKMLSILEKKDIFPLVPYILHSRKKVYMQALMDVTMQVLDKDYFFQKVYSDKNLLRELINLLSNYLLIYVERVENLEMETTEKRVVGRLLQFATRFGKKLRGYTVIQLPMTHEMLAESINVARENVTRILSKLQKENLITNTNGTIVILNEKKLQEYLQ